MSAALAAVEREALREGEIARALARASVYRLLATAFVYPTTHVLAAVPEAAGRAAQTTGPAIAAKLLDWAEAARTSVPAELAAAYMAVLDRPPGCSPYEGNYGAAPLLAGKGAALADIAGFYAAFGMTPGGEAVEVEDHIAAELEFMSVLALKEAAGLAEDLVENVEVTRNAQTAFLRDHLGRWGVSFADALCASGDAAYFGKAAELLAAWLEAEMRQHGVEEGRLDVRPPADADETKPFTCPMVASGTEDQ